MQKLLSGILLEGLEENHKNPVKIASIPAEIRMGHLPL
jgi:hypothetical protein